MPERDGLFSGGGVQAEAVFAEVVAAVDLGLYIYRAEDELDAGALKLVYANPASVAATGVEFEAIIGQPIRRAFPGLMDTELPAIYLEIALGGEARPLGEVTYGDARVREQVFLVRAFPLPERCVGISFTNMTAQRVAEQRAVQTLESMSDAFFTLDRDWTFTYLNRQAATIFQREREELVGKNIWQVFPDSVGTAFDIEYHRAVAEQVSVRFEQAYEPLEVVVAVRAHPITSGLAVYFADVTEERILRGAPEASSPS